MVVRGSCSCYGHAKRCIPTEDELKGNVTTPGKVHPLRFVFIHCIDIDLGLWSM